MYLFKMFSTLLFTIHHAKKISNQIQKKYLANLEIIAVDESKST